MALRSTCWLLLLPLVAACARSRPESGPVVAAAGTGRVVIPATRARVILQVVTRAKSAAAATTGTEHTLAQVLAAVRARSDVDSARVTDLSVEPNETDNGALIDFAATGTIELLARQLDSVGAVLDAAVQSGATSINRVSFEAASLGMARRQALARAYADAHEEALAVAAAGGQQLGSMVAVSVGNDPWSAPASGFEQASISVRGGRAAFDNSAGGTISISPAPEGVTVTASVTVRWQLRPK